MSRRDLEKLAADMGFDAEPTAGGHYRLTHPSGALVHASATPSCARALANVRGDLRRALRMQGVMVEQADLSDRPPPRAKAKPPQPKPARQRQPTDEHALDAFAEAGPGVLVGTVYGRPAELRRRVDALGARWELRWRGEP